MDRTPSSQVRPAEAVRRASAGPRAGAVRCATPHPKGLFSRRTADKYRGKRTSLRGVDGGKKRVWRPSGATWLAREATCAARTLARFAIIADGCRLGVPESDALLS